MVASRPTTTAAPGPALTSPAYTSPSITTLAGLLSDRQTLLAWNGSFSAAQLGVSTDGGTTWTFGKNFGGGTYFGSGLIETAGGEVLVSNKSRDGSAPGQVWRSTGWNKATADATSWTQVLTTSGPGTWADNRWSFTQRSVAPAWSVRPGAIFICEYGTKVSEALTAGNPSSYAATKAWMSTNDGVTWTQIFDLRDRFTTGLNAQIHAHGITYDPYDDRVLITQGDGGYGDGGACGVWYCNGEDLANPVWTAVPGTVGSNADGQITTIVPMESGLILLSDGGTPGGVRRIARRGFRRYGSFVTVAPLPAGVIGAHAYQIPDRPGAPLWLSYYMGPGSAQPTILHTTDGITFAETHREATATSGASPGLNTVVGPDLSGKVYAWRNLTGSGSMLTADYAPYPPDQPAPVINSQSAARWGLCAQSLNAQEAGSSFVLVSGTVYAVRLTAEDDAPSAARTVRIWQGATSTGATLAKVAVFDAAGNQLGVSADQSTTWNGSATSVRNVACGTFALTKNTVYYVAIISVGGTGPGIARGSNGGTNNAGLSNGASALWATLGTGLTDMPASITPGSAVRDNNAIFVGLA